MVKNSINDEEKRKVEHKVIQIADALNKGDSIPPQLVSSPLHQFLISENGRGMWHWFFSTGWPIVADCFYKEQQGSNTFWLVNLIDENQRVHQWSVLENAKGEIFQIRWL